MVKRRLVANAQPSKALWTIVDQLRTQGTLDMASMDALMAAAILEQIAIIIRTPHPTTRRWFDYSTASRDYLQSADSEVVWDLRTNIPIDQGAD